MKYFAVNVVCKAIEIQMPELLAEVGESFVVDRPVVRVGELAQIIGVLVLFAWDPDGVE